MPTFDFFISRAGADAEAALEICRVLTGSGYDVRIQDEDFPNGSNFIAGMSSLLEGAGGLVIILSEAYKQSRFCREEWTNFLAARSEGPDERKVLIFRVEPCEPPGILSARVYSDLFGIAEPSRRQEIILSAARGGGVPAWARQSAADLLWARVAESCRHHVEAIRGRYEGASDTYYVERHFEAEVDSFIQSDRSAIVIVGQSGMGKTTMVVRLLSKYHGRGELCFMFESARLRSAGPEVESHIVERLQQQEGGLAPKEFWTQISTACVRKSKSLIVFIDAVNEYSQERSGDPNPVDFVENLDGLIWKTFKNYPGVKFVITSRPETWRKAKETARSRFAESLPAYFSSKKGIAHELPRFSEGELAAAYEKYRAAGNISTSFAELSELTRYHLRDPLLLSLASQVYRDRDIPAEFDTGEVFVKYATNIGERALIDDLVSEMFAGEAGEQEPDVVRKTTIARGSQLRQRSPQLYAELDMEDPASPGYHLKDCNVLRQWSAPDKLGRGDVVQVRFTYDRFAEFLLATELINRFRRNTRRQTPEDAAVRLIEINIEGAQRMNVVFGALQQMLLSLQKEQCDYVRVLQRTAEGDPRALGLVISVLARTARTSPAGIDALERLLKSLEGKARPGKRLIRFPLIDAVYRVLRNEEYRLWLAERPDAEQRRHLKVLHGYFHWGFRHRDGTVSGTAIQYLAFLWRRSLPDAVEVTRGLIDLVSPLSLMAYLLYTEKRRLLQNVVSLMLLIGGEAEGERTEEVLAAARSFLLRLRIRESTALRLIRPLTKALSLQLRGILGKLRNPVKLSMLERFFANQAQNCEDFEGVISIFSQTTCNAELRTLVKHLAQSENSMILEFLTLALSAFYERQAALDAGADCLALLEELFAEESATAQYCASLALYHINYFGEHASQQTMELMGRMAAVILSERKGEFSLGGEDHNFNIIGTYGRALHRNGILLGGGQARGRQALQFAIEALGQAKEIRNFKYYLYVCENVGLLGVLIEPTQVFSVFTEILSDVKEISTEGQSRELVAFPPEEVRKARDQVLKSLANIRVLYRQEVDRYLLDELDSPGLYAEVANRLTPEFSLETFYSWTFEQLTFRVLTRYREQIGKQALEAFREAMYSGSVEACLEILVSRVLDRLGELSA